MIKKTMLLLLLFSAHIKSHDHHITKKALMGAIHNLDVEAVSRLSASGALTNVNMQEVFRELSIVEGQIKKASSLKDAVKFVAGLLCMAVAGNFIYKATVLNEDTNVPMKDLFYRLIYGHPGRILAIGATQNVFHLPLIAFSGSLFTVGTCWAAGGYSSLLTKTVNGTDQQRLFEIMQILMRHKI